MKSIITLLIFGMLVGCASQRELITSVKTTIPNGSTVAVLIPSDGVYMDEEYPKSGTVVARKLVAALTSYFPGSETVSSLGKGYVIKPAILHWEDRATEWSGKPDRVKVALPLYYSGTLIGNALVSAKSSYWTMGGDHPEDLLDLPLEVYAGQLAGKVNSHPLVIER